MKNDRRWCKRRCHRHSLVCLFLEQDRDGVSVEKWVDSNWLVDGHSAYGKQQYEASRQDRFEPFPRPEG